MSLAGLQEIAVTQHLVRKLQAMTDRFTHSDSTGAMGCRAAQKLTQPTGCLMVWGGDAALRINLQTRQRIVDTDAGKDFRLHEQGRGMNHHGVEQDRAYARDQGSCAKL